MIADNIAVLKKTIARTARDFGQAEEICLIAVSKQQDEAKIAEALIAGQRVFGENRVQEAEERWTSRRDAYSDLELHLIGPLQTNKVRDAVALFDVIETIDREKLADTVRAEYDRQNKTPVCFIQVNTGAEDQKAGVSLAGLPALLEHCRAIGLRIEGLMSIPPVDEPAGLHFALLKKIAAEHGLAKLSMGMSGDFEKAIALGATHVRLGTAVFGARNLKVAQ
ncbi:MAG: YggS family pyridoxal phosphate-dependent enzyme [Micavibrio sp.]|nr:YggS family pyridoxal phosphate-dependent enzyme [Micavibrio sp.]